MKVALVEDQELFIKGIEAILKHHENVNEIATYLTAKEALNSISTFNPDVIFLDLNLPDSTGVDVLKELRNRGSKAVISILSAYADKNVIDVVKSLKANAYLSKEASEEELFHVIENLSVNDKNFYLGKNLIEKSKKVEGELSIKLNISKREREILSYIAQGLNSNEIADKINISRHTVDSHRKNLRKKLNVNSSAELISLVLSNKIP